MYGFLSNILTSATHLLTLINDILDLSRIEAGRMELRPETFDLRETLASVERVMRGVASDATIYLEVHVDSAPSSVTMEDSRLRQILINLLSNAIKFSSRGGTVRLTVESVPPDASSLGCEMVRITVADHGIGMTPEETSRIFDEFYQVETSGKRRLGTGLGLPLTRRIVELFEGEIRVDSQPGRGSTFVVDLPTHPREDNVRPFPTRARA